MDERTTLRYIDELQGQIDQLKKIIKGGGGGGSVVINPEGAATADLEKIKKGDTIYGLNYNKNANRPQINNNLLTGNKNSKQLNIAENMTEAEYAGLSSKNEHEIYFLQQNASIVTETEDGFTITWEAYSDPAYVATLSYTPSDQDVTDVTSVTCDTDTIEIVTFSLDAHGDVSVTIGCEDPSGVPEVIEFTFTFTKPAGGTRLVKNGLEFGTDLYSESPVKVGTWIDGRPVYRQVIKSTVSTGGSAAFGGFYEAVLDTSEFHVDDLLSAYGYFDYNSGGTDYRRSWFLYGVDESGDISVYSNSQRTNVASTVVITYTRSDD